MNTKQKQEIEKQIEMTIGLALITLLMIDPKKNPESVTNVTGKMAKMVTESIEKVLADKK